MTIFGVPQKITKVLIKNPFLFLTQTELDKYKGVVTNKKTDWIAGTVALKVAYQAIQPKSLELKKIKVGNRKNGQPYILGDTKKFYSISHSFSHAIGAIAPYPIGVDIEKIKLRKKELLKFIATENETAFLGKYYKKNTELLTALWTIKESVMKAIGTGFLVKPKDLIIYKKDGNNFLVKVLKNEHAKSSMWKVETKKYENFYISIAYPKNIKSNEKNINWVNSFSISTAK